MANVLSLGSDFTGDTPSSKADIEEVAASATEATSEEEVEEEKETPSEPPAEEKPAESFGQDTGELLKEVQGLKEDRVKLIKEIQELRGQRREIRTEELYKVEEKLEELKDVHPEDVALIDKILKSKGYITKQDTDRMLYQAVQQEELNKFLEKYPEYKPENDSNDLHWSAFQRELGFYRMPNDPHQIQLVLERAHKALTSFTSSDRSLPDKKKQVELAGVGAGGTQRSSSRKIKLDPQRRNMLEIGGWSEEEIQKMESQLE